VLPRYPLRTNNVIVRGGISNAFYECLVAYNETHKPTVEQALLLGEALPSLAKVNIQSSTHLFLFFWQIDNHQLNEVMDYGGETKTDFQCYILLSQKGYTLASTDVQFLLC
jgi:DNA (cytosine-5)-methyltransferase 1